MNAILSKSVLENSIVSKDQMFSRHLCCMDNRRVNNQDESCTKSRIMLSIGTNRTLMRDTLVEQLISSIGQITRRFT